MADTRCELRLADEALGERGVVERERGRKDLERDLDLEGLVLGEVNGADAAAAELADGTAAADNVARLDFPHHGWHDHTFT